MSSMLQCFIPRPIFIGIQKWRIGSNSCLIQLAPCIWLPLSHFKRVNYQCTYYRIYSSIYNIYKGTTAPINVDPNSYMLFTAWRKMELWNLEKERGGQKGAKDSLFYHPPSILVKPLVMNQFIWPCSSSLIYLSAYLYSFIMFVPPYL